MALRVEKPEQLETYTALQMSLKYSNVGLVSLSKEKQSRIRPRCF